MTISGDCFFHAPVTILRLVLICWVACPIALSGLAANVFMLRFFCRTGKSTTPMLYLMVLILLDSLMCSCYVLIFGFDALNLHYNIEWLYIPWVYYGIPLFFLSKIAQFASPFILIAASLEQWLLIGGQSRLKMFERASSDKMRRILSVTIVLVAFILNANVLAEWEVTSYPNCTDPFGHLALEHLELSQDLLHYNFYVIPILQTFLPFPILIFFRVLIIRALKQHVDESQQNQWLQVQTDQGSSWSLAIERTQESMPLSICLDASSTLFDERRKKSRQRQRDQRRIRGASYTLGAIVTLYLCCTSISMLISILEYIPGKPLLLDQDENPTDFWIIATDFISFLFMFNSSIRAFIYATFDSKLRAELKAFYCNS